MKKEDVKNSSNLQFDIRAWLRRIDNGADVKDILEEVYAKAFTSGKSCGAYYGE